MLINLRNALMTGKRLPYDAEVEYLESTGTQYIDTGRPIPADFWFDATIDITGTSSAYKTLLGARVGSSVNDYQFSFESNNNNFLARYGTNSLQYFSSILTGMTRIRVESGGKLYINESFVKQLGVSSPSDRNMYIFALNNNGAVSQQAKYIRLYTLKYGGLNEDHDLIPVRKGTVGYLYDRVSGKLFGNAGSGDFVLGPDVVPVEWLGSYGYQYIDTGTIPDDTTGIEVVHTICPNNGIDNIIFGARQDSGNTRYWCDIDWGGSGTIGWGFNTYSGSSERFALASSDVGRVITNSLNYMNDRAGKIDGVTYDSSLQSKTLSTMNRSIYLFGANNQGVVGLRGTFKVYSAKISKGQTLVNKFRPVRVGTDATSWEGAMMDTITRRIYRNAGTGAFTYGNDLKYPIPAE